MVDFDKVRETATTHIDLLYPLDKRHKGIICPLCGNGQGKDGDGVTFIKNTPVLKCFRCGFVGDAIKLTAKANNISYAESAKLLAEKLGMTGEKYQYDPKHRTEAFAVPKFEHATEAVQEEKVDQTEYFERVGKFLSHTDYPARRGLSEFTCKRFRLGFDSIWRHPKAKGGSTSPRLIIPTSDYSYLARDVRENLTDDQKRYSKQKFGSVSLFNPQALDFEYAFITEGELDAISFFEVSKVYALALGSVSNIQKLVDYLKTAKKKPNFVIAALDNDAAGREGNLKLKQALKEVGVNALIADFIYTDFENNVEYKDANEILVKNRDAFIENIRLTWKVSDKYYYSDKTASQALEAMEAERQVKSEPEKPLYSDEELSEMIEGSELSAEDIKSMFEEEEFAPEKLTQLDNIFNLDEHPNTDWNEAEAPPVMLKAMFAMKPTPDKDSVELEKSQAVLNSISDFTGATVYNPEVIWAAAYCLFYSGEDYAQFKDKCEEFNFKFDGLLPFIYDYADKYIMLMNNRYWSSKELKLSDAEKELIIASSTLATKSRREAALVAYEKFLESEKESSKESESLSLESKEIPVTENEFSPVPLAQEVSAENSDVPSEQTPSSPEEETSSDSESLSLESKEVSVTENEVSPVSLAQEISDENSDAPSIQTAESAEISEPEKSKKLLNSITEFNNETVFSSEILQAAAYCKVYAPLELVNFLEHCREKKIKLTLLNEYIKQLSQPLAKIKRREDRQKEQARVAEEAKLKREAFKVTRYSNSIQMGTLLNQPQSPERDKKLIDFIQQSLERDHTGKVKSTSVTNFELVLNFDPVIRGCIGYDAFSQKIVPRRKLPWSDELSTQPAWANYDDAGLQNYLNRTYELNNEQIFFNVISEYAHKNSFHPVQDYFKGLPKWDGVTRAAEYFIDNLEIEDNRYTREIIKSWMTAAIARVFHPGCKWDYTLVIKGEQGVGKSTIFSKLAGKWFNDSIESIGGKETLENLLGSWIIELCEMQATKKADNELIKSFLSRQTDRFRVPYGRRTEEFLRQCVFAATTNDEEFLKDRTGNRHFLVLVSNAKDGNCRNRLSKLGTDYIDQVWAEIFCHYNQLFPANEAFDAGKLLPADDVLEMAKNVRDDYT